MSAKEKAITAYHEAGHAIVGRSLPNCDPVHKVSIVSRGRMGGYTRFLPAEDRHYYNKSQFIDNLACLLGGMAAEELTFGESSTGPQNDLQRATEIARSMVTEYGMASGMSPVTYITQPGTMPNHSDSTAASIDREVNSFVAQAQVVAREILLANREKLERIAQRLIDEESLSADQFEALFQGSPEPAATPAPSVQPLGVQPAPVVQLPKPRRRMRLPALAAATRAARDPFAKGRAAAVKRLTEHLPEPQIAD
jgi:cell division protease FtsH